MLTEQYNYAECKSLNACEVCFDESHTVFLKLKKKTKTPNKLLTTRREMYCILNAKHIYAAAKEIVDRR